MTKVVFQITGMHCVACAMNIDGELEEIPGVESATTSYAKSSCTVVYDPSRVEEQTLRSCLEKLGYQASAV